MNKILFISLTGMTEALGRSQVLEYITDLSANNKIYLLSFERSKDLDNISEIECLTGANDIEWHYLVYSNQYGVISSIVQIIKATLLSSALIRQHQIYIVHARSMIPATIGLLLKQIHGVKLIFDIRGFAIDEKVDSNRLRKGSLLFKALKKLDDYLYRVSDHIVTLTYAAKNILKERLGVLEKKITVIPTCANKKVFKVMNEDDKRAFKASLGYAKENKIILHTGTASGWYDFDSEVQLVKEMIRHDKNLYFLILNKNTQSFIYKTLNENSFPANKVTVTSASFDDVYKFLNIAYFSLFFITPSYSKLASAPTKFAENIACFLPSVTNVGIGDMAYYLQNYDVGFVVDLVSIQNNLEETVKKVLARLASDSFNQVDFEVLFEEHFNKTIAIGRYQKIYDSL